MLGACADLSCRIAVRLVGLYRRIGHRLSVRFPMVVVCLFVSASSAAVALTVIKRLLCVRAALTLQRGSIHRKLGLLKEGQATRSHSRLFLFFVRSAFWFSLCGSLRPAEDSRGTLLS